VRTLAATTDDRVAELPTCRRFRKTCRLSGQRLERALRAEGNACRDHHPAQQEVNLAIADPKIKERIASLGGVALPGSPADYGRTIAADTEKWAKVVQFSARK